MRRRFNTSHAKTVQILYSIIIRVFSELRMNITRNGRSQEILLKHLKIEIKWIFAYFMFHPLLLQRPSSYWFTRPPSAGAFLWSASAWWWPCSCRWCSRPCWCPWSWWRPLSWPLNGGCWRSNPATASLSTLAFSSKPSAGACKIMFT